MNVKLFLAVTFILLHFYPNGNSPFLDDDVPVHKVTEWFNECENDVIHILKLLQSPDNDHQYNILSPKVSLGLWW